MTKQIVSEKGFIQNCQGQKIDPIWVHRYISFINSRTENIKDEKHHIVPKSVNKLLDKDPENLVWLSFREHFIAHLLLFKALPKSIDMALALEFLLRKNSTKSGRKFAYLKEQLRLSKKSPEFIQKFSKIRRQQALSQWKNPESRGKLLESIKKSANTEQRKLQSKYTAKQQWITSRDKMVQSIETVVKTKPYKDKLSAATVKRYTVPEERIKTAEAAKRQWADPLKRAKTTLGLYNFYVKNAKTLEVKEKFEQKIKDILKRYPELYPPT